MFKLSNANSSTDSLGASRCDAMWIPHHLFDILAKNVKHKSKQEENSSHTHIAGTLQANSLRLLGNVIVMEDLSWGTVWDYKILKRHTNWMQCMIPDWIVDPQKDIIEAVGEIWICTVYRLG